MPEDLAGLTPDETPESDTSSPEGEPAESPVPPTTPDIEKMRAEMDERIKGFQRLISERDAELARLRQADEERRIATLPEDERAAYEQTRYQKEVERLRMENEVLQAALKYPTIFPKYDALMKAPTAEEQIKLLASWESPVAPPSPTEVEAPAPAPVDRNNPAQSRNRTLVDGMEMDDTIAKSILSSVKNWPRR